MLSNWSKIFQYTFKTENEILANKKEREAAEQAAAELAAQLAAEQAAEQAAAVEPVGEETAVEDGNSASSDDCEVLLEPHPTNPFLAVSGDVLIPTAVSASSRPPRPEPLANHQDLVSDFDVNNSNPFDGAELQSLSNFDALKSVLAPEPAHDFSLLDGAGETVYADVSFVKNTSCEPTVSNSTPPDPVYSTVNKPPAVIKSKKIDSGIEVKSGNGPQIHNTFTAVKSNPTFDTTPSYSPPSYNDLHPSYSPPTYVSPPPPPVASCSPFPKIPEEVVARAMQRLEHNQEECFLFLQEVLDVMSKSDCSAEVAEAASLLEGPGKKRDEHVVLIKQFTELGFTVQDIVAGLKRHPDDRDALLDFLVSNTWPLPLLH